ncbi:3-oxoacyl-ACP synthase III family protein [Streptomyces sp. NPDC086081]|uniref:3-oxoacyl-ACP synthase III family protein n=1 Tax=Streptomyces sp. NPDC086081 TaxID=3365749 RepID=UPI0038278464
MAVHLPDQRENGRDVERAVSARSPRTPLMPGTLETLFGFRERPVAPAGTMPSDLAAHAAQRLLEQAGRAPDQIDLLIFAGVSEDVEEPATAHIVAHKLGITSPVFDVRNACNGLLNALQIADALIRAGQHSKVLVTTGEMGSLLSRQPVRDRTELSLLLPGCVMGDVGAAMLVEAGGRRGILGSHFLANSAGWPAAVIDNPHFSGTPGACPVRFDGPLLSAAFDGMETAVFAELDAMGVKLGDIDVFCLHEAATHVLPRFCAALHIPTDKVISTFEQYGNLATGSLPVQLAQAVEEGRVRPGNLVALFGLASGASAGFVLLEW